MVSVLAAFCVAFEQAALFQTTGNAVTECVNECVEFTVCRRLDSMETLLDVLILGIDAVEKEYMVMNIEI